MDKETRERKITNKWREIMSNMPGSKLFGEDVDVSNSDELVVAAYLLGKNDERFENQWGMYYQVSIV